MTGFTEAEADASQALIDLALREDLGTVGDLTTQAFIPAEQPGQAVFVARSDGILAGMPAAKMTLHAVDPRLQFRPLKADAAPLQRGDRLATVSGPMRAILVAERTALNFLQRLSGIATLTRKYVEAVAGLPVQLLDTRKTTPGWRLLEKYAVRCGGGHNHRVGLYDAILIKDNHLAALNQDADPIGTAIRLARTHGGPGITVEIEVEAIGQFERALACGPDIMLLDNMSVDLLRECVRRRNASGSKIKLEASGGVNLGTARGIAETGVDRISIGALTHSATAIDIALDYQK